MSNQYHISKEARGTKQNNVKKLAQVLDDLDSFKQKLNERHSIFLHELASQVEGLLLNDSCRKRFQHHCKHVQKGYEGRNRRDKDFFDRLIQNETLANGKEELAKHYVLLAGVHDWMLPSCRSIYANIWPEFLNNIVGLILVCVEAEQGVFDVAVQRVRLDLAKARSIPKKIIGWIFKKTSHFVWTLIITIIVAIIIDILGDFGLIVGIKAFIYRIIGN